MEWITDLLKDEESSLITHKLTLDFCNVRTIYKKQSFILISEESDNNKRLVSLLHNNKLIVNSDQINVL